MALASTTIGRYKGAVKYVQTESQPDCVTAAHCRPAAVAWPALIFDADALPVQDETLRSGVTRHDPVVGQA